MFVVANRVPVAAGWEDSFEERFRRRAGQIEKQAGFVRMQVLRPHTEDTPYVVLTTWRDRSAFEAWVGSEDFKAAHSNPMPREAFDGEGKLEMHEVIVSAEMGR
jgi:heme-degrading monooxygenase HmoA